MKQSVTIDKDISWDREKLEVRLYIHEGYLTEQVLVRPDNVEILIKNGSGIVSTGFSLPVRVDNRRVSLSKTMSVYGETIDIKVGISDKLVWNSPYPSEELAG